MKKYELKALRDEINGEKPEGRATGHKARYLFLAYAFLRGVPYGVLEKKVGEHNDPRIRMLHKTILRFKAEVLEEDCVLWLSRVVLPLNEVIP